MCLFNIIFLKTILIFAVLNLTLDVSRARGSMGFYHGSVLSESNVPERFR